MNAEITGAYEDGIVDAQDMQDIKKAQEKFSKVISAAESNEEKLEEADYTWRDEKVKAIDTIQSLYMMKLDNAREKRDTGDSIESYIEQGNTDHEDLSANYDRLSDDSRSKMDVNKSTLDNYKKYLNECGTAKSYDDLSKNAQSALKAAGFSENTPINVVARYFSEQLQEGALNVYTLAVGQGYPDEPGLDYDENGTQLPRETLEIDTNGAPDPGDKKP
jgi:hypothetical protein